MIINNIVQKGFLHKLSIDLLNKESRNNFFGALLSLWPGESGNYLRSKYYQKKFKSAGSNLIVLSGVRFRSMENLVVGNNVAIGYDCFFQAKGGLVIGDNVIFAPGVKVWTVNHKFDSIDTPIYNQGYSCKKIVIEDDVFIASNSFIMPGAKISKGCVISAGSVVSGKLIEEYSILAGNPARKIGSRKMISNV